MKQNRLIVDKDETAKVITVKGLTWWHFGRVLADSFILLLLLLPSHLALSAIKKSSPPSSRNRFETSPS